MPTVKACIDRFSYLSTLEDSDISIGIIESDGIAEVFCDVKPPEGLNNLHITEWTQVIALIEIIRSIVGKTWSPDEIRFKSDFSVCSAAREANPNTRFLKHSVYTSIVMPSSVLAVSQMSVEANPPNFVVGHTVTDH